ncbi:factor H binding protein domain-containing protein [Lonepinella sp. BR2271]|uniref:factor H binding protein domain-containing protein n=1 Tax=Lonepinella sp. BR2271 TaxID=3434550 RepID=UPI003F6E11C7
MLVAVPGGGSTPSTQSQAKTEENLINQITPAPTPSTSNTSENAALKAQINTLESNYQTLQKQYETLATQLNTSNQSNDQLNKQLADTQNQLTQLQTQLTALQQQASTNDTQLNAQIKATQDNYQQLQTQYNQLTRQLANSNQSNEQLNKQLTDTQNQLTQTQTELNALQATQKETEKLLHQLDNLTKHLSDTSWRFKEFVSRDCWDCFTRQGTGWMQGLGRQQSSFYDKNGNKINDKVIYKDNIIELTLYDISGEVHQVPVSATLVESKDGRDTRTDFKAGDLYFTNQQYSSYMVWSPNLDTGLDVEGRVYSDYVIKQATTAYSKEDLAQYGNAATYKGKAIDTIGEFYEDENQIEHRGATKVGMANVELNVNFSDATISGKIDQRENGGADIVLKQTDLKTDNNMITFGGEAYRVDRENRVGQYDGVFAGDKAQEVVGSVYGVGQGTNIGFGATRQ